MSSIYATKSPCAPGFAITGPISSFTPPRSSEASVPIACTPGCSSTRMPSWAFTSSKRRDWRFAPIPFREDDLWNGYPEETNAPYGVAKKALLVQLQAYRQEYGFNGIYLLPVNLYGPEDNFDLETSHVIPAMIRKFIEARDSGEKSVVLWGDGSPTREFLYVEDAADGIVAAAEAYDKPEPVNLGRGEEVAISDLARTIAEKSGFHGEIVWDPSKPNGQPRRKLDVSRAAAEFAFRAGTSMEEGLEKTIRWYEAFRRTGS